MLDCYCKIHHTAIDPCYDTGAPLLFQHNPSIWELQTLPKTDLEIKKVLLPDENPHDLGIQRESGKNKRLNSEDFGFRSSVIQKTCQTKKCHLYRSMRLHVYYGYEPPRDKNVASLAYARYLL